MDTQKEKSAHRSAGLSRVALAAGLCAVGLCAAGCREEAGTATDAGAPPSRLLKGVRNALTHEPPLITDAGPLVVTVAAPGVVQMWPVDRDALQRVILALKDADGVVLAKALETHPAVDATLLARARAVKGKDPVAEQAEAALRGPLSLPVGGQHTPVLPSEAGYQLDALKDAGCRDVLQRPGAVGQLLPGVGRQSAVFLLQGADLERFDGCVRQAAPPTPGAEYLRLVALLNEGQKRQVAVLMSLGPPG